MLNDLNFYLSFLQNNKRWLIGSFNVLLSHELLLLYNCLEFELWFCTLALQLSNIIENLISNIGKFTKFLIYAVVICIKGFITLGGAWNEYWNGIGRGQSLQIGDCIVISGLKVYQAVLTGMIPHYSFILIVHPHYLHPNAPSVVYLGLSQYNDWFRDQKSILNIGNFIKSIMLKCINIILMNIFCIQYVLYY